MKTLSLCILLAASAIAHADDQIDVQSAEYLDVVETSDGSIWKGVLVEQTPNVQYKLATSDGSLHVIKAGDVTKISRQRNRKVAATVQPVPAAAAVAPTAAPDAAPEGPPPAGPPDGVVQQYPQPGGPYAHSGLRIGAELAFISPTGDISKLNATSSPTVRAGYELLLGKFGIGAGAMLRYSYWQWPGMLNSTAWTLESMAYTRAAIHMGRVALHADVAVGLDTNYTWNADLSMAKTSLGLGLNVGTGIDVAVSRRWTLAAGLDFHPGTDTVVDGVPGSISYYAVLLGAALRL
jgi:hypothetical protein